MQRSLRDLDTMLSRQRQVQEAYPLWSYHYEPRDTFEKPYTLLQTQMRLERKQHETLLRHYRVTLIGLCGLVGVILAIISMALSQLSNTKKCGG